jgi:hypothetical protein
MLTRERFVDCDVERALDDQFQDLVGVRLGGPLVADVATGPQLLPSLGAYRP